MQRTERSVLFHYGDNSNDNTESVKDEKNVRMEHWWNVTVGETAVFRNFS
jgi:hypothetical protein